MKTLIKQDYSLENCPVTEKLFTATGFCRLTFYAPSVTTEAQPGQFVMVHMPASSGRYMLPRPYSICSVDRENGQLVIFFEVGGRGGELISTVEPGTTLRLLGPLGRGFPKPQAGSLLVAGGMGIAPLVFLAKSTTVPRTLIYGSRTAARMACPREDLDLPGLTVVEVTEDGSRGERGTACEIAERYIPSSSAVFACGPRQLLAALAEAAAERDIAAWVSVEERMACGIGACLGCAVRTDQGYMRVCKDGPVFPAGEVNLQDEHTECLCQSGRN